MRLAEVRLHRAERDVELGGDLVVGQAAGHRDQHLLLALGQRCRRLRAACRRCRRTRFSSRVVTVGAISASPSAAARTAWVSSSGPASLSRKPLAPARSARVDVLVEVERGHDDDRHRVARRPARRARGSPRCRRGRACGCRAGTRRAAGPAPARRRRCPSAASPTTSMPACASRIIASPVRTISWSSATSTRSVIVPPRGAVSAVTRQPRAERRPASRRRRAASPVRSCRRCRSRRRCRVERRPVVGHDELHAVLLDG